MKLVDLDTGEELKPDRNGNIYYTNPITLKRESFKFGALVAPCEKEPEGLVKSRMEGIGWVQYYPSVFNARIVVDG